MTPADKLLDVAAAPTLERIQRDRQRVPSQLKPLLAYLETHLFDPNLDVNHLKRACGVRDNSLPIYFHNALSLPPYAYIEDCRLEVACRMLRDTDLKIWQIAQLLGYSTLQVFSRAFDRWSGLRPSVFRRQSRAEVQAAEKGAATLGADAAEAEETSLIDLSQLRRAVNGALEDDEALRLALRLAQLYPASFSRAAQSCSVNAAGAAPPADGVIRLDARKAWSVLEHMPWDEQLGLLRGSCRMASVDLVHLLVAEGIEAARYDPRRGVEVSSLATECLEALAGSLAEDERYELEVKAYSWLANACRRAQDFPAAEEALQRAQMALRPSCGVNVRTELLLVRSSLRMIQRRMGEALAMANEAVTLISEVRCPELRLRCRLHRAQLYYFLDRIPNAIADLWYAHDLKDEVEDEYLLASLYQSLSLCLCLAGQHLEAARYFPAARTLCQQNGFERALCNIEYAQGLVERDRGNQAAAETHLRAARTGFYERDDHYVGAVATLDLAILCATEERFSEAVELAGEAIEVFEGLNLRNPVLEAIQLLRRVVASEQLSLRVLREIRSVVGKTRSARQA